VIPNRTLVHSAVIDRGIGAGGVHPGWALFEGSSIAAVGAGVAPDADVAIDAGGGRLVPGFVDIHVHGGGGAAFDDGVAAIATARSTHRAHGTTRSVVSLVAAPLDDLAERLGAIADLAADDPTILGAHLEGPFLDDAHRGAHAGELLRAPDAAAVDRLLDAARGTLRQVTLAPELPGASAAIDRLVAAGVRVAIGHTSCDADTMRRAVDAGASILTHAFNGMPGIHHRALGPIPVALRDERVMLEVVADGIHVDPEIVGLLFQAAGDRVALVTDAMAAAGAGPGRYGLGGLEVDVRDGVARLVTTGGIAGSTLTQDAAIRIAVSAGVAVAEAVRSATSIPARAIGRPDLGRLAIGAPADAVLLDAELRIRSVWVGGAPAT
jgi:N-acetylglucosamine-6-phosphate deacetylase